MLSSLRRRLSGPSVDMEPDDAFRLLSTSRRRQVILLVADHDESLTVENLAHEIAACENEAVSGAVSEKKRKSVYISLIQHHLEDLEKAGVIYYDERMKTVTPTDFTEHLAHHIRRFEAACNRGETDAQ